MNNEKAETQPGPNRILGIVLLAGLLVATVILSFTASGVSGKDRLDFRVIDGDSVQIGARSHDLFGIDTPELGQVCFNGSTPWHCGLDAAGALHRRIAFYPPDCRPAPIVAPSKTGTPPQVICNTGGTPAAIILLEEGYATALENAPENYKKAENQAKRASLGLWRGKFVTPGNWRNGKRLDGEAKHAPKCPVKAIIGENGQKIFYAPLDREFPAIKIKTLKDGKCYGSDEAARHDGYRHRSALGGK